MATKEFFSSAKDRKRLVDSCAAILVARMSKEFDRFFLKRKSADEIFHGKVCCHEYVTTEELEQIKSILSVSYPDYNMRVCQYVDDTLCNHRIELELSQLR